MTRVALVGCGNIGYRHLQGLASLPDIEEIHVVEPNPARLAEVTTGALRPATAARLVGHATTEELAGSPYAMAIAAVTADRAYEVAEAIHGLEAATFLLEKPMAQSEDGVARMVELFRASPAAVYVNCPRALWAGYQQLAARIREERPVHVDIAGNRWGFGCNAVHFLELFRFLTGARALRAVSGQLAPAAGGSKRGDRFEEFSGTAAFATDRGDLLQLTCGEAGEAILGCVVTVRTADRGTVEAVVDEPGGMVWLRQDETLAGQPLALQFVSQSTATFYGRLVQGEPPLLPTLDQAAEVHRALFSCLASATGRREFRIT